MQSGSVYLYRASIAIAVLTFAGYFALTAYGDLVPVEQFGADLLTGPQSSVVRGLEPGSPADRAGLEVGDEILAIEGRPIRNALDWATVFARVEEGRPLAVTIARAANVEELAVIFNRRPQGPFGTPQAVIVVLTRFAQLVTLAFAIALAMRTQSAAAVLGFWLLATISIYSVGLPPRMAVVWQALPLPLELLFYLPSLSKVLIGFILFAFFRTMLGVSWTSPRSWLAAVPFVPIVGWDLTFLSAVLYRPLSLPGLTVFLPLVIAVNFAYVAAAVVMLARHYRTLVDPSARRRLRWIVAGSVFGCAAGAPTVAGLWLSLTGDPTTIYHSSIGLQLSYTAFLVLPASFWWAIARGQLFDLKFVVRRGLQYVFARRAMLVITPAMAIALVVEGALHDESLRELLRRHAVLYLAAAIGLVVFRSQRSAWMDTLDRRLFRERYDACQLLREVASRVRTTRDFTAAAEAAVVQIDAALHPEWLACYRSDGAAVDPQLAAGRAPENAGPFRLTMKGVTRGETLTIEIPIETRAALSEKLSAEDLAWLTLAGARLLVPVCVEGGGTTVCLVLGAKRSGEPFSQEDKGLLQAVAESVGELAGAIGGGVASSDEGSDRPENAWDRHLWTLADSVARGSHVDWASETDDIESDGKRQVLLELQALERLMQVHGAPVDDAAAAETHIGTIASPALQWGPFELRTAIGTGRYGTVYRAWDPKLQREVAVKLLNVSDIDPAAYLREARHLARVRHPNVVHVYGADEMNHMPGFWMELVEGRTLRDILQDRGAFTSDETVDVGMAMCRALTAIHRAGLVHQDVKAQNVMRDHDGRLVLMDFGAGVAVDQGQPRTGTPRYMAPELFDDQTASPRSDMYSLGVLLFLLASGTFPVDAGTFDAIAEQHRERRYRRLCELRSDLAPRIVRTIERALEPDPDRRFATSADMGAALAGADA